MDIPFSLFLLFLNFYLYYNNGLINYFLITIAFIFLFLTLFKPNLLRLPSLYWEEIWFFSWTFFSPIILTIVYILTILPVNIILRIFSVDLISSKASNLKKSYWINRAKKKLILGINFNDRFFKRIFKFLVERKKFWLLPVIILLMMFGSLIVITHGTAIAPFIYTIF